MSAAAKEYDYHGVLVVVETNNDEIVLVYPPGAPAAAPASLPSNAANPSEAPKDAASRVVRELTGLEVQVDREIITFIQPGTPTGTMLAHGFVARVVGGDLVEDGPEGPARRCPVDDLPKIVPVRVANQRVLAAYLESRPGRDFPDLAATT